MRHLYAFVGLSCALLACTGSRANQDGDGSGGSGNSTASSSSGGHGGSGNSDNCTTDVLASASEDCDGLGSAQVLLDLGAAEQNGVMTWASNSGTELTHQPSSGTTDVTLKLSYDGGEVRCIHQCDPCPDTGCGAPVQGPSIEVDAVLEITTADGALAESVPGVVSGFSANEAGFAAEVLPGDVQGTLTVTTSGNFENPSLGFNAAFSVGSATGSVMSFAHHVDPTGPGVTGPVGNFTTQ
jgi:hypothetical protein